MDAILIGAGNRGMHIYAPYAKKYPERLRFVGVAEPDEYKRKTFAEEYNIPAKRCFSSWDEILRLEKFADCAFICTQDNMHYEPSMLALEKGYHVLLEKPISGKVNELMDLQLQSEKYGRILSIAHVLRYSESFHKIKEIIDSGAIGKVIAINHEENIGFWHYAHSFVRGHWRNNEISSPIILAKACHDMDLLTWYADSDCTKVSSFGSLNHFNLANRPEGATEYCWNGCQAAAHCVYNAGKMYDMPKAEHLAKIIGNGSRRLEEEIRDSNFSKCVYNLDNDVMDTQVTILQFKNGVHATFCLSAFTNDIARHIHIMGTKGELRAKTEDRKIHIYDFESDSYTVVSLKEPTSGHEGGDFGIVDSFIEDIKSYKSIDSKTSVKRSIMSHIMALAAERSRVENKVIDIEQFLTEIV